MQRPLINFPQTFDYSLSSQGILRFTGDKQERRPRAGQTNDACNLKRRLGGKMTFRKLAAALGILVASLVSTPSAQATGDVWVEGSYEYLDLADVRFIRDILFTAGAASADTRQEFVNDDGNLEGVRFDGGIAGIPLMGGAYSANVKGFFAWQDQTSELLCGNFGINACSPVPLFDPSVAQRNTPGSVGDVTERYETDREINHWGVSIDLVTQGPLGLRAGPAFRRIDQDMTITGATLGPTSDPWQLTYKEDLETNYWGAQVGSSVAIPLGGGWALLADTEAGLYWADTEYSGTYTVVNSSNAFANLSQSLSLDSSELAFIGALKAALEKDFGLFKLAGFGRVEYISSAPDVAYNDVDRAALPPTNQTGPDNGTTLGERFAYTASAGARITVPLSGQ